MRGIVSVLVIVAFVLAISTPVLARGAPKDKQPFEVEQIIAPDLAPVVTSIPPLSAGYDVIQNKSTSQTLYESVTTEQRRQSTTVAESSRQAPQPQIVLLT